MNTMRFQGPGFALDAPTDWLITASPQAQAIFLGPDINGVRSNLIVTIRSVAESATLKDLARLADESQRALSTAYTVINEHDYSDEGGAAFVRSFTRIVGEGTEVFQIQALFLLNGNLFTMTGTRANEGDPARLAGIDATLEHMVFSFVLSMPEES
jgi:hypothetical protein